MTEEGKGPLQLDLQAILRRRAPGAMRFVPRWVVRRLERTIRQEELNGILRRTYPKRGSSFARAALHDLGISLEVRGLENIPEEGRFVFASNHPLGGLDGISLISVLGELYGDRNIYFLVNDLLMNVEPLTDVFLPINKYGSQGRKAAAAINDAYAGDAQILIFPAGLVSRLQGKEIKDLAWHKAFVAKALQSGRDIIPLRFEGSNSMKFYRRARLRKRLGIRINLEQAMLPAELVGARGSSYRVVFGRPVSAAMLRESHMPPQVIADRFKEWIYSPDLLTGTFKL